MSGFGFLANLAQVSRPGVLGIYLGEPEPDIKWPVPGQIAVCRERHNPPSGGAGIFHAGAYQMGTDPPPLMGHRHGYFRDEKSLVQFMSGKKAHRLIVVSDGDPKRAVPAKISQRGGRQRFPFRHPGKVCLAEYGCRGPFGWSELGNVIRTSGANQWHGVQVARRQLSGQEIAGLLIERTTRSRRQAVRNSRMMKQRSVTGLIGFSRSQFCFSKALRSTGNTRPCRQTQPKVRSVERKTPRPLASAPSHKVSEAVGPVSANTRPCRSGCRIEGGPSAQCG
jgi:hypothetical protein